MGMNDNQDDHRQSWQPEEWQAEALMREFEVSGMSDDCSMLEYLGEKLFEHVLRTPEQHPRSTIEFMAKTALAEEEKAIANGEYAQAAFYRGFLRRCD